MATRKFGYNGLSVQLSGPSRRGQDQRKGVTDLAKDNPLRLNKIHQLFERPVITDVRLAVAQELAAVGASDNARRQHRHRCWQPGH